MKNYWSVKTLDVMKENKKEYIDEFLYKYGLHDCIVSKIYIKNNFLVFCFKTGIYNLNEKGVETTKTTNFLMCLEINDLNIERIWEHVEILKVVKNKILEIDYEQFALKVDKDNFKIIDNYLSYFGQSILLDGYISKNRYQIKISEIKK